MFNFVDKNKTSLAIFAGIYLLYGDHDEQPTKSSPIVGPDEDLVNVVVPEGKGPSDTVEVVNPVTSQPKYIATVPDNVTAGSSFAVAVPRQYGRIAMVVPEGKIPEVS